MKIRYDDDLITELTKSFHHCQQQSIIYKTADSTDIFSPK